ncbi:MAG: glycosyltransferase family 4 protein [Planctomycetota bacterium]|nr:glycosyltransferase family 4 protein [Planctomycetota bacterium]
MTRPLKIAFIALGFPPDVGGTELYNVEYARRLKERGHDLRVFTWETESDGSAESDAALPFEVIRVPYSREKKLLLDEGISEALSSWGSEVIFISRGSKMLPNVVATAARHAPVVLSIHEFREKHRGRNLIQRWRVRRRYGMHLVKSITVNSSDTRGRLVDLGIPESQLATVYPGVDLSQFQPSEEAGKALREERSWGQRPVLLTVSRLAANKGHTRILEALPGLLKQFPDLLYVIVGKGPMREELEAKVAELNIGDSVEFTGLVEDVRPYYHACHIFCMTSTPQSERANAGEGFGIAYVEAGACEKAVLASSSGGGAEIVVDGETGRVVDPRKSHQVTAALFDLLENPEKTRKMGIAGRKRIEMYDWNRGVVGLEAVLRDAAGKS